MDVGFVSDIGFDKFLMLQDFRAKKHNINKIMRHRHLDSAGIVLIIKRNARDTAPTIRALA